MNEPIRRRKVDFRYLTAFLALAVLLGTGTHFLHAYQVRRNADALLEQANRAETENDPQRFADLLGRYVELKKPEDLEARARLALFRDKQARTPTEKYRAFMAMDDVLRRGSFDPKKENEVHLRAAELALDMHRPADARDHIQRLLEARPDDPELEDLLGRCEEESKQFIKARAAYELALKNSPKRVNTALKLARLLRSQLNPAPGPDRAADADKVMDAVVAAAPDSLEARLARCRYMQAVGNLDAAEKDLKYALEKLAPDNVELLLTSAELAQTRRRLDDARKIYEDGCKRFPTDSRFRLGLARVEMLSGRGHQQVADERLKDALTTAGEEPETLWTIADMFIDANDTVQAHQVYDRLVAMNLPPVSLDFLRARLLAAEGKTGEAVACLERCRAGGMARDGLAFLNLKMNMLLGNWYEKLENPDQQLAAFERVLGDDPSSVPARAGKAAALVRLGRGDEALVLFRSLIPDAPTLRLNAARLILTHNLRLPAEQRNWEEAERLMSGAPDDVKNSTEYQLLKLDLLSVSGRWDEARAQAESSCKATPKEVRFWLARAALAERGSKPDSAGARAILDEAEKVAGDATDLRLARAVRAASKPAAEAQAELHKLEENADHLSNADRGRLEAGLAAVQARLGNNKDAERLLNSAAGRLPADLSIRQQLFDLAMLAANDVAAGNYVEKLREVEGPEGVLWRYEQAARRVQAARRGDADALAEAKRLIGEVNARRRNNWHRVLVLEAEIAEIEGSTDLALDLYLKAIDRGERSPRIVKRAVQFLATRRKTDEARRLLQKVIEQSPIASSEFSRMLVEVSLPDHASREQSIEMAKLAVKSSSKDYRDFVWLGQVLSSLGEKKDAEAALRKALQMRPAAPEPRTSLVLLLAETGRKQDARNELDRAARELPEIVRPGVLALGREALGEAGGAEAVYVEMLKDRPKDPAVKHTLAAFYLRNAQPAKAEPLLRELAAGDGADASWGRRTLALSLAVSGDYQKSRTALEMLDKNLNSLWSSPEDQRARALVLAMRPGDRRESIKALKESFLRIKPTAAEEYLLAQLHEADHNWTEASSLLLSLVTSKEGATPEVLAFYIRALLRHNQVRDARAWFSKLEALEPSTVRTADLKARLLKQENQSDEAGRFLTEFSRKDYAENKDPNVLLRCAALLADLDRPGEAEKLYRQYVAETEQKHPESNLALAGFLASRGRISEALDLCERVTGRCPSELVAGTAVGALRASEPTALERQRVQNWLTAEIRKKPESIPLLVARADLLDACGDYAGSVRVYRDLVERNPNNILALNNLAWLLAVHENKGEEALNLIEKAIQLAGPVGDFLDTEASVLIVLGKPDDAVKKLEDAVQQSPTGPRFFHMTQALEKAGRHESAREAWLKATKELSLKEQGLHPLERADYQKFNSAWTAPKG